MNSWIQHPISLQGKLVQLKPLEAAMLDGLFEVAQDPNIWQLTSMNYSKREIFYPNFESALRQRDIGKEYPLLVRSSDGSEIIGTTRFLEISAVDKKLEIGVTWITSRWWGTGVNTECKYLLLQYCFEILKANRVQFRAKSDNLRSRRALEKIGAKFEGVFRKDKIEPGGSARNTAFYSIIDEEWPEIKEQLLAAINPLVVV